MNFKEFINSTKYHNYKNLNNLYFEGDYHYLNTDNKSLGKLLFKGATFTNCNFHFTIFLSTDFTDCQFIDCFFYHCSIIQCSLKNTTFKSCRFLNPEIDNTIFTDCDFIQSTFAKEYNTNDLSDAIIIKEEFSNLVYNSCHFSNVLIKNIPVNNVVFNAFTFSSGCSINFVNSLLYDCKFVNTNIKKASFEHCEFKDVSLINSELSKETFKKINVDLSLSKCFIDLQTIIKNEIPEDIYKLFGIYNFFAKDYVKDLVKEIKFQSVFISYSFDDKEFAQNINEILRYYGVNTFLWERDAPGGKRLKKIMSENIQKHDRLLFIASEHSLKSEACHYELQEAREKQNKEWEDIYFPIHIDDYLFTVRKEDIPRKYRDDFWENIEEVKEFHSKNFSMFKAEKDFKSPEFEAEVKQLIKNLKL